MFNKKVIYAAMMAGLLGLPGLAFAAGGGHIYAFLGGKTLEDSEWAPWEDQGEFGFKADIRGEGWPLALSLGYYKAESDTDPFFLSKSTTTESHLGIKKIWDYADNVHFSLGGGLAEIDAKISGPLLTSSGSGTGLWLSGAVYFTLSETINLGFEMMSSSADVNVVGIDVDGGGGHFGGTFGVQW